MKKEPNLFPLKMLVISMGIVLVGGTVFVAGTLISRASQAGKCHDATLDLSDRGPVTGIYAEGKNLRILVRKNDEKFEVVTADPCSGKVLGTFTILSHDGARAH